MPLGRTVALLLTKETCGGYGCQRSPVWSSNGVEWAGSEDTSTLEYYEHNVDVGQKWSSEVISLFLEDWEVGRVALSCHL